MECPFESLLRSKYGSKPSPTHLVNEQLCKKYGYEESALGKYIMNDIIKNKPTHITSIFKEYLVFDEPIEFLKRYYFSYEWKNKLVKLTEFHNSYFKVFPNFINIPEKHYMYKNIERKQRVIDDKQYRLMRNKFKRRDNFAEEEGPGQLFNDSYHKHMSTFRSKFEKEVMPQDKFDFRNLYLKHKTEIGNQSRSSKWHTRLVSHNNSMENILSKVNTSDIKSGKFEISDIDFWSFIKLPPSNSKQISIRNSPEDDKEKQEKKHIKDRKSHVFDVSHKYKILNKLENSDSLNKIRSSHRSSVSHSDLQIKNHFAKVSDKSIPDESVKLITNLWFNSVIELSGSLMSSTPKESVIRNLVPNHIPKQSTPVNELATMSDLNGVMRSEVTLNSKNNRILAKNMQNSEKYNETKFGHASYANLKAKLKHITSNKRSSPNKKVMPFSYDKSTKQKYPKNHTKSKKSESHHFNSVK